MWVHTILVIRKRRVRVCLTHSHCSRAREPSEVARLVRRAPPAQQPWEHGTLRAAMPSHEAQPQLALPLSESVHHGYLTKRPFSGSAFGTAKRRYIILFPKLIQWYKTHDDVGPLGEMAIRPHTIVSLSSASGTEVRLALMTDEAELHLSGTANDMSIWRDAIEKVITDLRVASMHAVAPASASPARPQAPPAYSSSTRGPAHASTDDTEFDEAPLSTLRPASLPGSSSPMARPSPPRPPPLPPPPPNKPTRAQPPSPPPAPSPASPAPPAPLASSPSRLPPTPAVAPSAGSPLGEQHHAHSRTADDRANGATKPSTVQADPTPPEAAAAAHAGATAPEPTPVRAIQPPPSARAPTSQPRQIKLAPSPRKLPRSAWITSLFGGFWSALFWGLLAVSVAFAGGAMRQSEFVTAVQFAASARVAAAAEVVAVRAIAARSTVSMDLSWLHALDSSVPRRVDLYRPLYAIDYVYRAPLPSDRSHFATAYMSLPAGIAADSLPPVGASLPMECLRDHPSISRLKGYRARMLPATAACWSLLPAVICIGLVARRLVAGLREARLLKHGQLTFAMLTHRQRFPPRLCYRLKERWLLTFEFTEEPAGPSSFPVAKAATLTRIGHNGFGQGDGSSRDGNGTPSRPAYGSRGTLPMAATRAALTSLTGFISRDVQPMEDAWQQAHQVTLRVEDPETLERVTNEEWEPVLYLPGEPSVAMLMDSLPPSVRVDPGRGLFVSSSWAQELVPPVLMVVALVVGWHLAHPA